MSFQDLPELPEIRTIRNATIAQVCIDARIALLMPVTKKSEDHCRSYYAATANELASYPVLEGGGKIGVNLNRLPLLGRIGKNVYYSQGYAGHGVNVTHVAGEVVADAICGTMERFDLFAKIKHHRLPLGQWFSSQIIALGMLYYRMRDLI